jgi:hypothetical protein
MSWPDALTVSLRMNRRFPAFVPLIALRFPVA